MKIATVLLFLISGFAFAQQGQLPQPTHPPMGRGFGPGPGGKWWDNPEIAKRASVTAEQKKKMDDVFTQSRMRLIDLHASLEKDELTLDSLMQGPALDDTKLLPAIDKIAQDRAELEKADARLLLGIRHILTPEQWTLLDQHDEHGGPHGGAGMGGGMGAGMSGGMRGGGPGGMQFRGGPGGPGGQGRPPMPPGPPQE
jgi:Spy/CpxP family protein refolding chaperone